VGVFGCCRCRVNGVGLELVVEGWECECGEQPGRIYTFEGDGLDRAGRHGERRDMVSGKTDEK
jgi:hypothetical protein